MFTRVLAALGAAVVLLGTVGAPTATASTRPDARAAMHFGVVLKFHGVKIESCRSVRSGVTSAYYRLDTRGAKGAARAKVKSLTDGELGATGFSSVFPRYQKVGRVLAFNGYTSFAHPGAVRQVPVIQLKSGGTHAGTAYRIRHLHRC